MSNYRDNHKVFSRRSMILAGINLSLFGVLAGRMTYLQIFERQKYSMLAEDNRINISLIKPLRGEIFDRRGRKLAINRQNFSLFVIPERLVSLDKTLEKITQIVELKEGAIKSVKKRVARSPSFLPVMVKETLTWDEMAAVQVHLVHLPGVLVEENRKRYYPHKEALAHVIGYVGAVNQSELRSDPVLSIPGFQIGKTGLEKTFETKLRGRAGRAEEEINASGRKVREINRDSGHPGDNLDLTLDLDLQRQAYDLLKKHKSGAAVVLDVHTGAIYAAASAPAFDPNQFAHGLDPEVWELLRADPKAPMINKAIAGQYPPGSTFKMVTALAALDKGVVNPYTTEFCPGFIEFGKHKFHCWKRGGHGKMNLVEALTQSCDVFFYNVSQKLGIEAIAETARKLGLGVELGVDLYGERSGLIPDKAWKKRTRGRPWTVGETILASIGQGYIQTTPLQLATMQARLVNGQKAITPHFVQIPEEKMRQLDFATLPFKKEHLELVQKGMWRAVNAAKGTAFGSRLTGAQKMGGKTGTAQVKRITQEQRDAGYDIEKLPWRYRHHALFVGYAPADNPRIAASVVIEHGVSGSRTAAPVARKLLSSALKLGLGQKPQEPFG